MNCYGTLRLIFLDTIKLMVIIAVLGAGFGQHIYDLDLDAIHKLLKARNSGHSFHNQSPVLTQDR